ncbi:MAG: hypothetical protein FWD78_06545 [Treponema sp.]|nr:hypothetical protein [Treponema sp.]
MLYPKNSLPFAEPDFQNPGSEYRAAPFWAWNTKLDRDELIRQIEILKAMGFGGFHMHVRTGMATDYLSDDYMDMIGACVENAKHEKMLAWLYDEDRWPSGAAGGLVTKNPANRIRHLLLTRHPYGDPGVKAVSEHVSRATSRRCENGELLACFDVVLDGEGSLLAYKKISAGDTARGFKLYAYAETALPNPWFNNQTYADTLNPDAIKEFIRITHERYAGLFGKDFGGVIPAIFTDEPQFSQKGTLRFADEDRDVTLPWTSDFAQTFGKTYGNTRGQTENPADGKDLIASLPELLWDLPGGKVSLVRYHYHDHIAERFSAAFADQVGSWCSRHNILLTGHMMEEPTLESQTHALGEAMRSYRSFGLPGIDMLCDRREFTTAKQAQSAARQYGNPGVLSELYGVTNWDFDFRGHKLQGDWQAALGVSVRVPHLSWVSMNGEAKRDYPGTFNYQAPWYNEYPYIENHFARLNSVLTRGEAISRVAVIHPIESYWLHWGPRDSTEAVRSSMDEKFQNLCDWLLRGLLDFDYICESTLPDLCDLNMIGTQFPAGKMKYDAVIVPQMETIRSTTMDRLEAFRGQGGRLIFMGPPPAMTDAVPDERGQRLWDQSEHIEFDRLSVLNSLEELRDISIRDSSGALSRDFIYQYRQDSGSSGTGNNSTPIRWLFICHAGREQNRDIPRGGDYRIRIRGEWQVTEYNTMTGTSSSKDAGISAGWTEVRARLWDHDSLLLKLSGCSEIPAALAGGAAASAKAGGEAKADAAVRTKPAASKMPVGAVDVTLHEPNVLLLDIADYALDDGQWRGKEEILRLDNALRAEFGWPLRCDSVAQPWVEQDKSVQHKLRLRFTFESELDIDGAELALENADVTSVVLNGMAAGKASVNEWYADKCIGRVKLPAIKAGTNVVELTLPYGKKTDAESCYLLGDFSVKVQGTLCTLGAPVRKLYFGDITGQGLPFYGGNLTYHLEAQCRADAGKSTGSITVEASSWRFMLLKAAVDGKDRGIIAFSPYKLTVDRLAPGKHKIDLTGFGCRVNTFGQLHNNMGHDGFWWGPGSWRTEGPGWSYEYRFWPQGILKSPEVFGGE